MVIFKLKSKIFAYAQKYTIDNKSTNETDKTSKAFTLKQYKIINEYINAKAIETTWKTEIIKKITPGGSTHSVCSVLV